MFLSTLEKNARKLGIVGPILIVAATIVSLVRYHLGGGDSHPFYYWPVSGLGDHNVAPWPRVFNAGIIGGAFLMALFMIGVALRLRRRSAWIGAGLGVVASMGLVGVGIFPSAPETLNVHYVSAGIAFLFATTLGALFVLYIIVHEPPHFPKWLALPSLFSVLSTGALIAAVATLENGHKVQVMMLNVNGVKISGIILLEWLAFSSLQVWIFLTALGMRPNDALVISDTDA